MSGIEVWSTTAASNNAATPNGWPEGQAPSTVNDCGRQMMASIRTWYESAQWINLGYTHTYASGTSFTIAGTDVTATYAASRRIKAVGSSTGTIYGAISSSSFSTNTTVNITWDSGSLSNETLTVYVGIITPSSNALPAVSAAPFIDSTAIIKGSGDATKLLKIEVDGFTTGTTRTLTPQNKSYTIADDADFAAKANLASPTFTGVPAAPTATVGTNTTQLATTAFVIANAVTFTKGSVLTKNPYAASSTTQQAHGLSGIPNLFLAYLENLSTELGYSAGDRVNINGGVMGGAGSNMEITINADATNVNVTCGAATPYVGQKATGGDGTQITAAKWKLIVTPVLM